MPEVPKRGEERPCHAAPAIANHKGMSNTGRDSRQPRLIVGISRSRASWWALAWAVGEARRRGARLLLVHVFRPSYAFPPSETGQCYLSTPPDPDAGRIMHGNMLIQAAIRQAVGQMPGDVAVEKIVFSGRAATELARLAYGGDVVVLGARRRGWLRRLAPGSVARACARRAECPVLMVPEPSPETLSVALPGDSRGHWFRWIPHHAMPQGPTR